MFAKLGDITFELLTAPENISSDRSIELAEHKVLMSKPTLQFLGVGLESVTLPFSFSSGFCDPKVELKKLEDALVKAEPMTLVFANGENWGSYVIESSSKQIEKTDEKGNYIFLTCNVGLKEHFEAPEAKIERLGQEKKTEAKNKAKATTIKRKKGKNPKVSTNYKKEPLEKIVRQGKRGTRK